MLGELPHHGDISVALCPGDINAVKDASWSTDGLAVRAFPAEEPDKLMLDLSVLPDVFVFS
jgi:hypothetical protein